MGTFKNPQSPLPVLKRGYCPYEALSGVDKGEADMSSVPPPPGPPDGYQPPMGQQPPPPGYQPAPPGYQPAPPMQQGMPGQPAMPASAYASWGQRVGAWAINYAISLALLIVAFIVVAIVGVVSSTLAGLVAFVLYLGIVAVGFYFAYLDGEGQSPGKAVMGIQVVSEQTGRNIGGGMGIGRQFVHILDGFCFIGYLFPLWDAKRQTFADKILNTVVVPGPKEDIATAIKRLIPKKVG
jgi:uncharacterized RDD family membrane protein YckC